MNNLGKATKIIAASQHLGVLTGAGISAESGVPTFRGKDGYWVKGGRNYHPMDLATYSMFRKDPETVWEWYHHRRQRYAEVRPNSGHYAIVELEQLFEKQGRQFHLVTQNVDGLHLRAGSNPETSYHIHGEISYMRCAGECEHKTYPIPEGTTGVPNCPEGCGANARPHVLWFDETYNEHYFKFNSSLHLADEIDALMFVGTELQTNLPYQVVAQAIRRGIPVVEVNPTPTDLGRYGVTQLVEKSGVALPQLVSHVKEQIGL